MPRRTTAPVENVRGYGRTAISEDPEPSTPRITNASHTNASHTNAAQPYRPSWDKNVSNHLEAYILRPQLQHEVSAIRLSYIAEKLSLDSIKLEQHVDRLGPDHSIIDDVRNLQAEQYRQIDTVLKQRNGKLVSVHRDTVEMPTSMGHMHATTLTFVLSTTDPGGQEPSNESGLTNIAAATLLASLSNIQESPTEATKSLAATPSSRTLSRSPSPQQPNIPSMSGGKKPVESSEKLPSSSTLEAPATPTVPRVKSETPSSEIRRIQSEYDMRKRDQRGGGQSEPDQKKQDRTEHDQKKHGQREPDQTRHDQSENDHSEPINTPEYSQNSPLSEGIFPLLMSGFRSETPTPKDYRFQNDNDQSKPEERKLNQDEPNETRSDQGNPDDSIEKLRKQIPFEDIDGTAMIRPKSEIPLSKGPEAQSKLKDTIKWLYKSPKLETATTSSLLKAKSEIPPPPPPPRRTRTPLTNTQNKIRESTGSKDIAVEKELDGTLGQLHKPPKLETATTSGLVRAKSEMPPPPPPPPARREDAPSLMKTQSETRDSTGPKAIADDQEPDKGTTVVVNNSPLIKIPPTPTLSEAKLETQQSPKKVKNPCIPTATRELAPQSSLFKDTANEREPKKGTDVAGEKLQLLDSPFPPTVPTVHSDTQEHSEKLEEPCIHTNEQDDAPQSSVSKDTANKPKLQTGPTVYGKILLSDYFEAPQGPQINPSESKKKKKNRKKTRKRKSTANQPESPTQTRALSLSSSDTSTLAGHDDPTSTSVPEPFGIHGQNCKKCNAFLVVHSKQELERRECDLCHDFRDTGCTLCKEDFQKREKQGESSGDMGRSADGHRAFLAQCVAWSRQQRKTLDEWNAD